MDISDQIINLIISITDKVISFVINFVHFFFPLW
jgi:hypothetical protein